MTRSLQKTPDKMVENGKVSAFGCFDKPFKNINIQETDVFGIGNLGSKLFNKFRLKEWQHFVVMGPDFLLTFVIVNAHYISNSFCYYIDRKTGEMIEYVRKGSPSYAKLADELWDDHCSFDMNNYTINVHNNLNNNLHSAEIDIKAEAGKQAIHANLEFLAGNNFCQPIVGVLKLAENRPAYSHKVPCPAKGTIKIGDKTITLDPAKDICIIDVHKAYYPYNMKWKWATCGGFNEQGQLIALNLTHNVIKDDKDLNENGIWVGNKLSMFEAARFDLDETNVLQPWTVETTDSRCKVTFTPEGERAGIINAGIIYSNYHQPYGTFSGQAIDDDGKTHIIKNLFGVTEYHTARF